MEPEFGVEEFPGHVVRLRLAFVNVYFVGPARARGEDHMATPWALIDAGVSAGTARILEVAAERYGKDARPAAIILTHGHFDHVGALQPLLSVWDVPVYAHPLELPFLTGESEYPPPDPSLGGGSLAKLAPLVPKRGMDLGGRVRALPANGDVPGMPGWRWVHTPGHAPGHVSLFRAADRFLIAGDAVTTTQQESLYSVARQREALNGPPKYFTIDWDAARRSVATLASLKPIVIAAGHGSAMEGATVAEDLVQLARDFDHRARPDHGRYVQQPAATNEHGVIRMPPRRASQVRWGMLTGVAAAAFASTWLARRFARKTGTTS